MDKRIIYETDNGGVAVMTPNLDIGLTIDEIAKKDVPEGKAYFTIDYKDIPKDLTYRNSWKLVGKKIVVDEELKEKIKTELDKIANMPTIESLTEKLDKLEKKLKKAK
jgi:hypothetical protein